MTVSDEPETNRLWETPVPKPSTMLVAGSGAPVSTTLGETGCALGCGSGTPLTLFYMSDVDAAPIPEPATMLLLGSGLLGFWGVRRKFKK